MKTKQLLTGGWLQSLACRLAVIVLLIPALAVVSAATGKSITGKVVDRNGAVIVAATVRGLNRISGQSTYTTTDSSGTYRIDGLSAGPYLIYVSRDGFVTFVMSLIIDDEKPVTQDFRLEPGTIRDEITVTAGKGNPQATEDVPQIVTTTDGAAIERQRTASTLQAIELSPNLTSVQTNPVVERPRLRGLTSNRVLVLVDGERLNNVRSDPTSGVSPGILDPTQLGSIEVTSGAGSSLYGSDAMAGTINFITAEPFHTEAGQVFNLRFDGIARTNGFFRRGGPVAEWSNRFLALRLSGSSFSEDNYRSGNQSITQDQVVSVGRFANQMASLIGNNVARTYGVWNLPAQSAVPNSSGRGFNDQVDLWYYPSAKHSLRYRQLNSQHKDLGFPFITPPFDPRDQFNGFRRLDKYGLRYEGSDFNPWLTHLSVSLYRQKYSFADDNVVSTINPGSSWDTVANPASPQNPIIVITGNPSVFTLGSFTDGKNSVRSHGFGVQATMLPFKGAALTSGMDYLRDSSKDSFSQVNFQAGTNTPGTITSGRASNPDTDYDNLGWFNQVEYEPTHWLRLLGGLRIDNWKTSAKVTSGFPLGTEAAALNASLGQLAANPGPINVAGLQGVTDLINGTKGIKTNHTVATENVGAIVRLPDGINAYFRWGNSYRQPGITEQYILRDFGDPTFSVLLSPNTMLKPERGSNHEVGVKLNRDHWKLSAGYFRNNLTNFITAATSGAFFIPANPALGLLPVSPFFPFHGVLYAQRTNTQRARIQGFESTVDGHIKLGRIGIISPFTSIGWLKGSSLTPDSNTIALINRFYNRGDTIVPLTGTVDDAPLSSITPFRGIFGATYNDNKGNWFGQYQIRYQARITRIDPLDLSQTITTQFGTFASLGSFSTQSIRLGYGLRRESYRVSFVFGIDDLTNKLYFEQFQTAPAPGRSFVFGVTTELFFFRH